MQSFMSDGVCAEHQDRDKSSARLVLSDRVFVIGLLFRLIVSNGLLDQFISYTSSGGSIVEKLHPGTLLVMLACMLPRKKNINAEFASFRVVSLAFFTIISYGTFYLLLRSGLSSIAYIVDTFLCAIFAGIYLATAPQHVARLVVNIILVIAGVNAFIGIGEMILQKHLLPDPGFSFGYFRSYAIFGHPLLNALMTGTVGIFVLRSRVLGNASVIYFLLLGTAILAFGARAALLVFVPLAIIAEFARVRSIARTAGELLRKTAAIFIGTTIFTATGLFLMVNTRFGERFIAMSDGSDNSIMARFGIKALLESMNSSEILFGVSPQAKQLLIELNPYLATIENFWVDMALSFGIVTFAPISVMLICYIWSAAKSNISAGMTSSLFFLIVASTNNSLSVKSPALLMLVVLLIASRGLIQSARCSRAQSIRNY
ncbi:MAG: hypothetical protein HWE26_21080 [Alteromonadaceae bacterium]|nr:hypothetical protein [Alteromonadaceae bacterium]